ncbi:hypothetical protein ABH926_002109 [Catenulispora sp. GP43]|uniref:hypothetical protein n=1 Tax=Catenulispora sp. GP43 TaxID=3156263 RepID=UPI003515787B
MRLVPCSSPGANFTVIKQIASDLGGDCGGGPVVYDFTQHTGEHELCIEPKQ